MHTITLLFSLQPMKSDSPMVPRQRRMTIGGHSAALMATQARLCLTSFNSPLVSNQAKTPAAAPVPLFGASSLSTD